jgi:hypothetical protein
VNIANTTRSTREGSCDREQKTFSGLKTAVHKNINPDEKVEFESCVGMLHSAI